MNPQEAKKLEQKTLELLNKFVKPGNTVIAAISGGPDSVFLLEILKKCPFKVIIAHLNHGLRKESDKDELFVKKIAAEGYPRGTEPLEFHSKKINLKALSKKIKKGSEETGRIERYKFFNQLAKNHNATHIITAHHADDNIETILMNVTRGSGLQGLSGMQILELTGKTEIAAQSQKNKKNPRKFLLRPLLNTSKKQITDYLKFHRVKFTTDRTNKDTAYTRNHLRRFVIPELKKINPSLPETIAKNSKNLREINEFLKQEAKKWLKKNLNTTPPPEGEYNKKTLKNSKKFLINHSFSTTSFRFLHPALQKQILRTLHENFTSTTKDLEATHINEVLKIINENIGNKQKKLGRITIKLKNNTITIAA